MKVPDSGTGRRSSTTAIADKPPKGPEAVSPARRARRSEKNFMRREIARNKI